ncbi:hypothetical protein LGW94_10240, partial [Streptococcus mutans]|nr:hypothetical protein [Streptococcus mutans]
TFVMYSVAYAVGLLGGLPIDDKYDFSISVINNKSGRLNNNYFQSGRFMSKGNKIYVDVASSTAFYVNTSNNDRSYDRIGVPIFN